MEPDPPSQQEMPPGGVLSRNLLLSIAMMLLGGTAGPLLTRFYFLHGGARLWLTSLLQACAFPVLFFPLSVSYLGRWKGREGATGVFSVTGRAAAACAALGIVAGLSSYMLSRGSASLPVSTSSLLSSTQVGFTAAFASLLVRQRFTPHSVNAVVLLLMGAIVLGLQSDGDRLAEEPDGYYLGFFLMLGAAAMIGLLMTLIELTCISMKIGNVTHVLVLEMQVVLAASASTICVAAMLINKDFQAIPMEAKEYGLGETMYYLVLASCAIAWQLMNVGLAGVIFCSSSLLAGIVNAMLVPLGEILPVLVLHEKFNGGKVVAMVLSIWGCVSYLHGEHQQHYKTERPMADEETALLAAPE